MNKNMTERPGVKPLKLKRQGVILEPKGEIGAIFNCGAAEFLGGIYLLPRVVKKGYVPKEGEYGYKNYISEIWLAKSKDGKEFTLSDQPVIKPDKLSRYGCEDPRITRLEDTYLITYTALSEPAFSKNGGDRIGFVLTKDFSQFEKHGIVGPDFNSKAGAFFPEKIGGKTVFLFKNEEEVEEILIAFFPGDILNQLDRNEYWKGYDPTKHVLLTMSENNWENRGVETGAPPIKTNHGWLLIYSGISKEPKWSIGAALLDLNNPQKVIARSPYPILEPEMDYERIGDIHNVIFPEGAVVIGDELFVYYGAADKTCCLATCKLDELIDSLLMSSQVR